MAGAVVLVLATAPVAPRMAWAQSDSATREAEARFKEGLKRHDAGDEEGARLSFVEAYTVLKRPNLLFNLARAEQLTGHPVDAIAHYKAFAADSAVAAADRETARKHVVELNARVGHIEIDAPSGAELWVDGQMLSGKAPLSEPADVSSGPHTVEARLAGLTKTTSVTCDAGQTVTAKIELDATPAPVVPAVVTPAPVPGGMQTGGSTGPAKYGASGAKVVTTAVFAGVAVAAIATGVGMQVAAGGIEAGGGSASSCRVTSVACIKIANDAYTKATDENVRTAAFVGAGVFAAAAVLAWVMWPNSKVIESSRHIVPLVAPGVAGLAFVSAF